MPFHVPMFKWVDVMDAAARSDALGQPYKNELSTQIKLHLATLFFITALHLFLGISCALFHRLQTENFQYKYCMRYINRELFLRV